MKLERLDDEKVSIIPETELDRDFIHFVLNDKPTWYFLKRLEGNRKTKTHSYIVGEKNKPKFSKKDK